LPNSGTWAREEKPMSSPQIVQLLITLAGIALAMLAFLFGPFGTFGNAALAFVIFVIAGIVAGFAYAKLSAGRKS
jgi:hypothetical protein